ncbi:hypothetical protein [Bradyrhizobium sp. AZCC 1721]|uniref:hypothetical protein n=1 Tax=Bradyrhizobium sp. AZCC 1721 TaxID=3117016 RepID=UPI002FF06A3C
MIITAYEIKYQLKADRKAASRNALSSHSRHIDATTDFLLLQYNFIGRSNHHALHRGCTELELRR